MPYPEMPAGTHHHFDFDGSLETLRPEIGAYTEQLKYSDRFTPVVEEAVNNALEVKKMDGLVFYIAGALTGMSDEVKQRYVDTSELIAERSTPRIPMFGYAPHLHGTDPVKHPNVTPEEVRDVDYLWASVMPYMHINFLEPVAHGNAVEAGWAELYNIPTLHVAKEGFRASRLIRGMNGILGTVVYKDFATDGLKQIGSFLDQIQATNAKK